MARAGPKVRFAAANEALDAKAVDYCKCELWFRCSTRTHVCWYAMPYDMICCSSLPLGTVSSKI